MSPAIAFLGFIIAQRLSELVIARRNTARLMADGATEIGAAHYPAMVTMHAAWIAALVVFGWQNPVSIPWLVVFVALQGLRLWILATLGSRWTTRIILTDTPLVTTGPFRYLRHPNYTLVVAEIIVAPMVLGLVWVAVVWTALNAAMLYVRISAENAGLAPQRD